MRLQPDLKSFEYSDGCNSGARPYRSCIDSWGRYSHRDGGSLCRAIPFTRGCVQVYRAALNFELEAPPGFEPGMEVLQPGSGAFRRFFRHYDLAKFLRNLSCFAFRRIRWLRGFAS